MNIAGFVLSIILLVSALVCILIACDQYRLRKDPIIITLIASVFCGVSITCGIWGLFLSF
jgi:hypothetical protein